MARDFDGVDDQIDFGSDASIDDFTTWTVALWARADTGAASADQLANKGTGAGAGGGWALTWETFGNELHVAVAWSGADAEWVSAAPGITTLAHIAVTYDGSSTANDPVIYFDGVSQTVTENVAPSGTFEADAANSLIIGQDQGGGNDLDGLIGNFCYDNTIWTADQVRRHMRWGIPRGGTTSKVWHPLDTSSLTNKGSATANGSATGTTMVASAKTNRRHSEMLIGVGS